MYLDNPEFCCCDVAASLLYLRHPLERWRLRVHPWTGRCRMEVLRADQWTQDRLPMWDIPLFAHDMPHSAATWPFFATLPADVGAYILRYPCDQLTLLRLCALSPAARRLAGFHPNLLWYLAPRLLHHYPSGSELDAIITTALETPKGLEGLLAIQGAPCEARVLDLLHSLGTAQLCVPHARECVVTLLHCYQALNGYFNGEPMDWGCLHHLACEQHCLCAWSWRKTLPNLPVEKSPTTSPAPMPQKREEHSPPRPRAVAASTPMRRPSRATRRTTRRPASRSGSRQRWDRAEGKAWLLRHRDARRCCCLPPVLVVAAERRY